MSRRSTPRLRARALRLAVVMLAITAGSAVGRSVEPSPVASADPTQARTVTVFAAASLMEVFRALAAMWNGFEPHTRVDLNFAASSTLVRQIAEGATPDLFASADEASMEEVRAGGHLAGPAVVVARSTLAIAVEPGNPKRIASLADLGRPGLIVALGAPAVPAGRYAREAFRRAGVPVPPASEEIDVKAALTKVELGEADAAIVYLTDVRARPGRVDGVTLPAEHNVDARYYVGRVARGPEPEAARRFLEFVMSPRGQQLLERFGFRRP